MSVYGKILERTQHYASAIRRRRLVDRDALHLEWEAWQLRRLFRYLDVDCVFDVGANEGQYASMLRDRIGYQGLIISFEPIPSVAETLRRRSSGDKKWHVVEGALSDSNGSMILNVMQESQFSSLSSPSSEDTDYFDQMNSVRQKVSVSVETLASAYNRLRGEFSFERPFLKMDTQGFDVKIASGSADVLRRFVGLQSELSVAKLYVDSVDFRESTLAYQRMGFELCAFVPNNAGHFPRLMELDCIMIRSDLVRT